MEQMQVYDNALKDIENKLETVNTLSELLDLYARQSTILKLMLELLEKEEGL